MYAIINGKAERTKDISPQVRIPSTSKRMDRLAGARSTAAAVFLPAAPDVVRRLAV